MQNRLVLTFLLFTSFALGGVATWGLTRPNPVQLTPPNIIVVRTPPAATLRGHGWELTLPAPDDGAAADCLSHDDCGPVDDADEDEVISI